MRDLLAAHFRTECRIAKDEIVRDYAGAQDFPRAINVIDEGIKCVDALGESFFEEPPLGALT